ncbi:hypothetical protein S245_060513, partial [Arachis hypogaea]
QEVLFLDNEIAFNEAIIEEREQGIQEIQQQIGEVNEIFKDLAVFVHEQEAMIDDIGSNIEQSHAAIAQARSQLAKASKTQRSNSSLMLGVGAVLPCCSSSSSSELNPAIRSEVSFSVGSCLLPHPDKLILQWLTGIFVLIYGFVERKQFSTDISSKLGSSFSIVLFVIVVSVCTILTMIATLPVAQLFFFHILLVEKGTWQLLATSLIWQKENDGSQLKNILIFVYPFLNPLQGINTYDYIIALTEQEQEQQGVGGQQSPQMSTVSSLTGFSSASSFTTFQRGSWCTPPHLFDEDQFDVIPPKTGSVSSLGKK